MKKFKKKDKSLYVLIIRNYLIFSLVMVGLMLLFYLAQGMLKERLAGRSAADWELSGKEFLLAGNYDALSMEKLLGHPGFFEIADDTGMVIYPKESAGKKQYSAQELSFILPFDSQERYRVTTYHSGDGQKQFLVQKEINEADTGYREDVDFWILDELLQVILGELPGGATKINERELAFLSGDGDLGYRICKYEFTGNDGAKYTLLMHVEKQDKERNRKLASLWKIFLPVYAAGFLIVTLAFTLHMHKKVKEPLTMLHKGILDLSDGERDTEISYQGPKEFEEIFDSFNVMAHKLKESEQSKERLLIEKQRMLADISHDLKTPITVIRGYASAVADGLADEEMTKQYLDTIFVKTESLTEMINNFYDYSKLEHPEFRLLRNKGDFAEFVREYLAEKYDEIQLAGFLLEVEIPEEEVLFAFDEVQIKRVFDNILSNALKHNPAGTTIFVTLAQTDKSIRMEIGDNGVGIPEEIRAGLFDPFVVGDDSRHNRQGSGLGLAVAAKITELHGGALFLENAGNPLISTLFVLRFMR